MRTSLLEYNPKWSWADPMENEAAPGTYNYKSTFDSIKGYSMPKAVKRVGKNSPTECRSPGSAAYSPVTIITKKRAVAAKMGTGPARKLDFIDSYRSRSPGPVYKLPGLKSKSSSFGRESNRRGFSKSS